MNKKLSAIVDDAMARSTLLIEAIPASKVLQRANSERIAGLCKELVSTRPACDPVTPRVCELGEARYSRFPKPQTLLNAYGPLLRIWREAFQKLVSASAPMPVKGGNGLALSEADLNGLDFGTKARVVQALAALRESKLENDRLKSIIRESIPAPGHAPAAPAMPQVAIGDMRAIQGWLSSLDSGGGGLEVAPVGLRVSIKSRPGTVVMSQDILAALRKIGAAALGEVGGNAMQALLIGAGAGRR